MAKDIKSPCNSVCQLSGDICKGCGRTRWEIKTWKRMKRPDKQSAAKHAALRLQKLSKKAG